MAKKPANLIYSVDDKTPVSTLRLGIQHVSVMSVGWIFVVVIVTGWEGRRNRRKA
jgi:xanthine/uracil permease